MGLDQRSKVMPLPRVVRSVHYNPGNKWTLKKVTSEKSSRDDWVEGTNCYEWKITWEKIVRKNGFELCLQVSQKLDRSVVSDTAERPGELTSSEPYVTSTSAVNCTHYTLCEQMATGTPSKETFAKRSHSSCPPPTFPTRTKRTTSETKPSFLSQHLELCT